MKKEISRGFIAATIVEVIKNGLPFIPVPKDKARLSRENPSRDEQKLLLKGIQQRIRVTNTKMNAMRRIRSRR